MKRLLIILWVWTAATVYGQPANEASSLVDRAWSLGQQLFDEYAPDDLQAEYAWPDRDAWQRGWSQMQQALRSGSLEELAWMRPQAHALADTASSLPALRPYVDWLKQRLDYFDMAGAVVKGYPEKRARVPARPRRPPPAPPAPTREKRAQAAGSEKVWVRKLKARPKPPGALKYESTVKRLFREQGVAPELVWLAEVESTFNPSARSPVGAAGLFQFMPATAERFGMAVSPDDQRLDPEKSATAAATYLRLLYRRFASWPLALAAYNAGEGRVSRTLKKVGGASFEDIAAHLPTETRMYVPKVLATIEVREGLKPEAIPAPI